MSFRLYCICGHFGLVPRCFRTSSFQCSPTIIPQTQISGCTSDCQSRKSLHNGDPLARKENKYYQESLALPVSCRANFSEVWSGMSERKTSLNTWYSQSVKKSNSPCHMLSRKLHSLCRKKDHSIGTTRDFLFHVEIKRGLKRRGKAPVLNPVTLLQPHMAVNILPKQEVLFEPTIEEIEAAEALYVGNETSKVRFLKSALATQHLPTHDMPEVSFIGRSNVGKSSLIKTLLENTPTVDVKVSSKPGHTRLLNFYTVGRHFSLVDMPGYGFKMPEHFTNMVESYLSTRLNLVRTFALIDSKQGITATDRIGLDMMEEFSRPYVIVLTKIDRAPTSTLLTNLMEVLKYRNNAKVCFPQPFLVSSETGDGISLLQTFIAHVTGCVAVEGYSRHKK